MTTNISNVHCDTIIPDVELQSLEDIERSIQKTYRKTIWKPFIKSLKEFSLVNENDKIAVAISGGKDSLLLAKLFQELKRASKTNFDLEFISMNPGFNSINLENLKSNLKHLNIDCHIYNDNIFEITEKISKEYPCYMCAKMRRGSLYTKAKELGCNKLALGHHLDDVIETILLNIFQQGKFETMLPKFQADNFENIELIRPLYYVEEKNIINFIKKNGINAMNCGCTVAAEKTSSKRKETKDFINLISKENKNIKKNILNSSKNVNLEKIISWKKNENTFSIY